MTNIFGIGTDIVEIQRIEVIWNTYGIRFAKRILSPNELKQLSSFSYPVRYLSKHFTAKEAIAKALGTGFRLGVYLTQISIEHTEKGKPIISFLGKTKEFVNKLGILETYISISDEASYTIAFAITGN